LISAALHPAVEPGLAHSREVCSRCSCSSAVATPQAERWRRRIRLNRGVAGAAWSFRRAPTDHPSRSRRNAPAEWLRLSIGSNPSNPFSWVNVPYCANPSSATCQ